jgi:RimJ/RimL family protein N-acetyltransferase
VLRQFTRADADAHHRQIGGDPRVTWSGRARTLEDTRKRIADFVADWETRRFGMWAVVERATHVLIGHAGLQPLEDTEHVEIGYYLGRSAWGRGFASEAGRVIVSYADRIGLPELVAVVRPENVASQRVLVKLEFELTGAGYHYDADVQVRKRPAASRGHSPSAFVCRQWRRPDKMRDAAGVSPRRPKFCAGLPRSTGSSGCIV